jgi:hypothetical protein
MNGSDAPRDVIRSETEGVSICGQERSHAEEALLQMVVGLAVFGGERVNLSERYDYPSLVFHGARRWISSAL